MASRKLQVLDFAKRYVTRWGRSPSYGEIAGELGIGRERVKQHVRRLVDEGLIVRETGTRRGISFPDLAGHISEADALQVLKDAGYGVLLQAAFPPCTFPTLPPLPELEHIPDLEIGENLHDRGTGRRDRRP